jgi:hypothetical protein
LTNATTGSERVAPGQQPPGEERSSLLARLTRPAVVHWQFGIVVLAAVAIRAIVMLGYPPIMWFNDSYNYIEDAVLHTADAVRPDGYPFFLNLLWPLHSLYPVALLQAGMGLAMGVTSYALLRHRGLPWWGATLPALPVLFDVYELHLEHMVTADTLFTFLVTVAVIILCWSDKPSVAVCAVAGLLTGYATLVRSVGQPLLIVLVVGLLVRRVGWRRLAALVVAGIVPIAAYMIWFHASWGEYALTESRGTFLYSRVSTFAECDKINPPASVRPLCDPRPPAKREVSGQYIWAEDTPLAKITGTNNAKRFTPAIESQTQKFAQEAILAQPVDYLRVVIHDTMHTFGWTRQPDPFNYYGNGPVFRFGPTVPQVPWWATANYPKDKDALVMNAAIRQFSGPGLGQPSVVQPWATWVQNYQRIVYLPGTLLGIIVLIGAAGVLARWRRWGGIGLLPWLVGALLIVLPPMTAGFSYRYVLAAVPSACLAAGLAFAVSPRGDDPPGTPRAGRPGGRAVSVRALAADLRRHLGRGVAVDQE